MLAIRRDLSAWNSTCEVILCGEDRDQLEAVADAAVDELARWEKKLSLSNPQGDLSRINRSAGRDDVCVDQEMIDLLKFCLESWRITGGWFDVSARTLTDELLTASVALTATAREPYQIRTPQRTVRFLHPNTTIDLNGIGRAYALDRTIELIRRYGLSNAQLGIGGEMHFSMGTNEGSKRWEITPPSPFLESSRRDFAKVWPRELGTSWAATLQPRNPELTLAHPPGEADSSNAGSLRNLAVFVVAKSAAIAQVWSIAGLKMTESRWRRYLDHWTAQGLHFGWTTDDPGRAQLQWLTAPPCPAP